MTEQVELIGVKEVCRLTSLSRPYVFKLRTAGRFPKAVPIGEKRVAFVRGEVEAWVRDRIAERDGAAA